MPLGNCKYYPNNSFFKTYLKPFLLKLEIKRLLTIDNGVLYEQSPRAMMVPDSDPRPAKKRSQSSVCELTNLRR